LIIMIDIDHFEDYNDRCGHPAGDDCLQAIAHTIRGSMCRPDELAARYGGEEMVVMLPGSDAPRAYALAAHDLALRHAHSEHGIVTFSAGVATCVVGRLTGGWQALVGDADAAQYAAKTQGRDSVATCPCPLAAGGPAARGRGPEIEAALVTSSKDR
jgi:diguanylate cyclase (GGDEF)-like protein